MDLVDAGRKLNVHNTFRTRPGRPLNVLCTFTLRPVSLPIAESAEKILIAENLAKPTGNIWEYCNVRKSIVNVTLEPKVNKRRERKKRSVTCKL